MDKIEYQITCFYNSDDPQFNRVISHQKFVSQMPLLLQKYKALKLTPLENEKPLFNNFEASKFAQNILDCHLKSYNYS